MIQNSPTLALLLPFLPLLLTAGGSGHLACWLMEHATRWLPIPRPAPAGWRSWPYRLIHAPRYRRWTAIGLALLISLCASALLAAIDGRPIAPSIDATLAAFVAAIWSQLKHGQTLPAELPQPAYTYTLELGNLSFNAQVLNTWRTEHLQPAGDMSAPAAEELTDA